MENLCIYRFNIIGVRPVALTVKVWETDSAAPLEQMLICNANTDILFLFNGSFLESIQFGSNQNRTFRHNWSMFLPVRC